MPRRVLRREPPYGGRHWVAARIVEYSLRFGRDATDDLEDRVRRADDPRGLLPRLARLELERRRALEEG